MISTRKNVILSLLIICFSNSLIQCSEIIKDVVKKNTEKRAIPLFKTAVNWVRAHKIACTVAGTAAVTAEICYQTNDPLPKAAFSPEAKEAHWKRVTESSNLWDRTKNTCSYFHHFYLYNQKKLSLPTVTNTKNEDGNDVQISGQKTIAPVHGPMGTLHTYIIDPLEPLIALTGQLSTAVLAVDAVDKKIKFLGKAASN